MILKLKWKYAQGEFDTKTVELVDLPAREVKNQVDAEIAIKDGYVICPKCLKYNKEERKHCVHCGQHLANPITGGILQFPGIGTLINCKKEIDNEELYKIQIPKELWP